MLKMILELRNIAFNKKYISKVAKDISEKAKT